VIHKLSSDSGLGYLLLSYLKKSRGGDIQLIAVGTSSSELLLSPANHDCATRRSHH
jgi:hypothetical protein